MQKLKNIWRVTKQLWRFAESLEDFKERVSKIESDTDMILRGLGDVDKLMTMVSNKELAMSEQSLFKANDEAEKEMTMEEIDTRIQELTTLKASFNTSPAIGSRMIRARNYQLTDINRELEKLVQRRVKWER